MNGSTDVGTIVHGAYRLSRLLGEDALGQRYTARDQTTRKQVEVLLVRADRTRAHGEAFDASASLAATVVDERVVQVLAHGRLEDRAYRVTAWVGGSTLQAALSEPILVSTAVQWARDVALGLQAAHQVGLIHGGLSPASIRLVKRNAAPDQARVDDFGLAALLEGSDSASSLGSTAVGGASWTAPEYALGRECTARSDLYALGAVLFHALTGRPPFVGPSMKVLAAHVGEVPPAPSSLTTGIPLWLDELVLGLLEKDPSHRPQTAREVAQRLLDGGAMLVDGAAHPERVTANVAPVRLPNVEIRGAGAQGLPDFHRAPPERPKPLILRRSWVGALSLMIAIALVVLALVLLGGR